MALVPFSGMIDEDSGAIYAEGTDESGESGAISRPYFGTAPEGRLGRKLARIQRRESRVMGKMGDKGQFPLNDAIQALQEQGGIVVDQFIGLGRLALADGAAGNLVQNVQRHCWVKRILLTVMGGPIAWGDVDVTAINVAGLPFGLTGGTAPVVMWGHDATGFFLSGQRRWVIVGQAIQVGLINQNGAAVIRSTIGGAAVDEPSPYVAQTMSEMGMVNTLMGM